MELDHVFVLVEPDAPEAARLAPLAESFRRRHEGQGTANVCYCFDNAYLELLWAVDSAELADPAVSRTRLGDRARWKKNGASPFGIAVRHHGPLPFATWTYRPPMLPDGIAVAIDSDDPRQPFVFRSPGDAWKEAPRQDEAGLVAIAGVVLEGPRPAPALRALAEAGVVRLATAAEPRMILELSHRDGGVRRLSLPDFVWLD